MKERLKNTIVLESRVIADLRIIREKINSFPAERSNIYALNAVGDIIWFAELPVEGDIYSNPIQWNKSMNLESQNWSDSMLEDLNSFVVSSQECFRVCKDYKSGKILQKEFTK